MIQFLKSIPKEIIITVATIVVLLVIVFYEWGYINGKSK